MTGDRDNSNEPMASVAGSDRQSKLGVFALVRLVATISRREARHVLVNFRLFLALLSAGVFAIAVVGSLSGSLNRSLERDGRDLIGADLAFSRTMNLGTSEESDFLNDRYEAVSSRIELTSFVHTASGGHRHVSIKAVDSVFPLIPRDVVEGKTYDFSLLEQNSEGEWGILIAPELRNTLNVSEGDTLLIGEAKFELRGTLAKVVELPLGRPDIAPVVVVSIDSIMDSGVVRPGSLYSYQYRVLTAPGTDLTSEAESVRVNMPEGVWQITDARTGSRRVRFAVDTVTSFFTLVGLVSLMVAGIGMMSGVNTYMDTRRQTIAILKSLGASSGLIIAVYLLICTVITALGVIIGLSLAAALPNILALSVSDDSAFRLSVGIFSEPLIYGAFYGFGVSLAGALWSLSRLSGFYPQSLFRDLVSPVSWKPRLPLIAVSGLLMAGIVWMTFFAFGANDLTRIIVLGMVASPMVLLFCAWLQRRILLMLPRSSNPILRLAIHGFCRPGSLLYSVFLSVGLGLTLLTTLAVVDSIISEEFSNDVNDRIPSFFVLGIQLDEIDGFRNLAAQFSDEEDIVTVPTMRGRILSVKGMSVEELEEQGITSWALNGDRGLTWSNDIPTNSVLSRGDWWQADYSGSPLVSLTTDVVEDLGMEIGDSITVSISGRPMTATLAAVRDVEWSSFAMNFAMVFDSHAMKNAPGGYISTVRVALDRQDEFIQRQQELFPAVTPIRVQAAMEAVRDLVDRLLLAVRVAGGFALIVGIMVLAGSIAADHRRRSFEAGVYTVCGVSRRRILQTCVMEYGLIAAMLMLVVLGLSLTAVIATVDVVFDLPFSWQPGIHLGTPLIGFAVVVISGVIATAVALAEKPSSILRRNEALA